MNRLMPPVLAGAEVGVGSGVGVLSDAVGVGEGTVELPVPVEPAVLPPGFSAEAPVVGLGTGVNVGFRARWTAALSVGVGVGPAGARPQASDSVRSKNAPTSQTVRCIDISSASMLSKHLKVRHAFQAHRTFMAIVLLIVLFDRTGSQNLSGSSRCYRFGIAARA